MPTNESVQVATPVHANVETIESDFQVNSTKTTGEEIAVKGLEDEEFGEFVSISKMDPDPVVASDQSVVLTGTQESEEKLVTDSSPVIAEPVVESTDHSLPSEVGNNNIATPVKESPVLPVPSSVKSSKEAEKVPHQSPVVDRLSLKKGATKTGAGKERTGKRVTKKESHKAKEKTKKKRSKLEAADKTIDDNQSEVSYQPDTDLSRSKVSKKVNGKKHKH